MPHGGDCSRSLPVLVAWWHWCRRTEDEDEDEDEDEESDSDSESTVQCPLSPASSDESAASAGEGSVELSVTRCSRSAARPGASSAVAARPVLTCHMA